MSVTESSRRFYGTGYAVRYVIENSIADEKYRTTNQPFVNAGLNDTEHVIRCDRCDHLFFDDSCVFRIEAGEVEVATDGIEKDALHSVTACPAP